LQRHRRLHDAEDFARIKTSGRRVYHRLFILSFVPNNLAHNRYGLIVTRRIGKATRRNRVRRQLREALRLRDADIRLTGDNSAQESPQFCDIVLIARLPVVQATFVEISMALDDTLRQAHLLLPDT
jgi:ribonuclease P protein component